MRKNYVPWLMKELKVLMKERDYALHLANSSNDPITKLYYKNLKNTVTSSIRKEKRKWEQEKLNSSRNNPDVLWKNVKSWLSWGNSGPPSKLIDNGTLVTSPKKLAETMNKFFVQKVKKLKESIPSSNKNPCSKLRESMASRKCSFSIQPVGPEEIEDIVMRMKNSKSTGIDNINILIIKLALPVILPALTHVVNLSITTSRFQEAWKLA